MAEKDYQAFNNFQTTFYTDKEKFKDFTRFEIKSYGYVLLSNLAKGFPNLADLVLNLKGFDWNAAESPAILQSLQFRFINNFHSSRIPQFIYYKGNKADTKKEKVRQVKEGSLFDSEIQREICSILQYDSKTYDYLKFSEKVQYLGHQINGEFLNTEKLKSDLKSTKKPAKTKKK